MNYSKSSFTNWHYYTSMQWKISSVVKLLNFISKVDSSKPSYSWTIQIILPLNSITPTNLDVQVADRISTETGFLNGIVGRRPQVNLRSRARCLNSIGHGVQPDQWRPRTRALDLRLTWGLLPTVRFKESTSAYILLWRRVYSVHCIGYDSIGW